MHLIHIMFIIAGFIYEKYNRIFIIIYKFFILYEYIIFKFFILITDWE